MAKKSFTLIELLVVVAIIAVLIAILLPALNAARDAAKAAVCVSHQRQIGIAIMTYVNQFNGYIVPAKLSYTNHESPLWFQLLMQSQSLFYDNDPNKPNARIFHCPADDMDLGFCSYSGNLYTMGQIEAMTCQSPPYDELFKVRTLDSFTRSPGNVILIGDMRCRWNIAHWYAAEAAGAFWWSGSVEYMGCGGLGFYWKRHNRSVRVTGVEIEHGRAGFLLADGHAQMFEGTFPVHMANTDICIDYGGVPGLSLHPN